MGRLADVGMALRNQASLAVLTEDVIKTSEIEGEQLNVESLRSSIARRLGVDIGALAPVDRHVDGVVEMVLDATAINPYHRSVCLVGMPPCFPLVTPAFPRSTSGAGVMIQAVPCK